MRSVEPALLRKFEGRVIRETICEEVQRPRTRLGNARIRTFLPVLVQNVATDTLRRRTH